MATNGTPPPTWPIEPTLLFVVTYYETNALSQAPTSISLTMRNYNDAVDRAKQLITDNGNEGVCAIQQVTASIVYPSIPWSDF
jgi:hypothetical protein